MTPNVRSSQMIYIYIYIYIYMYHDMSIYIYITIPWYISYLSMHIYIYIYITIYICMYLIYLCHIKQYRSSQMDQIQNLIHGSSSAMAVYSIIISIIIVRISIIISIIIIIVILRRRKGSRTWFTAPPALWLSPAAWAWTGHIIRTISETPVPEYGGAPNLCEDLY